MSVSIVIGPSDDFVAAGRRLFDPILYHTLQVELGTTTGCGSTR
jgi:hypothetical protein